MVVEEHFTSSDYLTCDYLDCGEADCFDLSGEPSCMCVDTLSPPDVHGTCSSVETGEKVLPLLVQEFPTEIIP